MEVDRLLWGAALGASQGELVSLRFLRAQSASPWLCLGGFNEVLSAEEQFGGNGREPWQIAAFQDVVNDYHLSDLGFMASRILGTTSRRKAGMSRCA